MPSKIIEMTPRDGKIQLRNFKDAGNPALLSVSSEIVRGALLNVYPWIADTDVVGIEQYCRAEARARILGEFINDICDSDGPGQVPGYLWQAATAADLAAMKAATSLGLNPEGRLKIAKDAGFATHFAGEQLETLLDKGASMRKRR